MTSPDLTTTVPAPPVASPVLCCRGLRKAFEGTTAVDGLSFAIAPGETYGLLGPNGAGKTTTILIVAGVVRVVDQLSYLNDDTRYVYA